MNPGTDPSQTPSNQPGTGVPPQPAGSFQSPTPAAPAQSPQTDPVTTAPQFGQTDSQPSGVGQSSGSKKALMIGVGAVVLLALIGTAAAMSLHHTDKSSAKPAQQVAAPASPTPSTAPSAQASKQTIPVNQTITDDTMGLTIKVLSVDVGKLSIPAKYQNANSDKTVVTANVSITSTGKYALSLGDTLLNIIDASGETDPADPSTTLSDPDLKALGLPVLSEQDSETSAAGYVAFWVPTSEVSKLTLRYTRQSAGVIGSSQTIPRKTFDVVVR